MKKNIDLFFSIIITFSYTLILLFSFTYVSSNNIDQFMKYISYEYDYISYYREPIMYDDNSFFELKSKGQLIFNGEKENIRVLIENDVEYNEIVPNFNCVVGNKKKLNQQEIAISENLRKKINANISDIIKISISGNEYTYNLAYTFDSHKTFYDINDSSSFDIIVGNNLEMINHYISNYIVFETKLEHQLRLEKNDYNLSNIISKKSIMIELLFKNSIILIYLFIIVLVDIFTTKIICGAKEKDYEIMFYQNYSINRLLFQTLKDYFMFILLGKILAYIITFILLITLKVSILVMIIYLMINLLEFVIFVERKKRIWI